ncbi:hypothetical protein [Sphingobacterium detergens]|uniref:hypothetical protein n=1 Tax=Sphingobacterium detergens TaxID=1145106 RepID=UPI003AB0B376
MEDQVKSAAVNAAVSGGITELTIREGDAPKVERELNVVIVGVIDSPVKYLKKRIGTIDPLKTHVVVDRERNSIELKIDEHNPLLNQVKGSLMVHPMFSRFGINNGQYHTPEELADFFKMNRSFFESEEFAMKLVSTLKNFKAKVKQEVERANDDRGNVLLHQERAVESNLPDSFNLVLPLFKGFDKVSFEVEVYIHPQNLTCTLVSPVANVLIEQIKDTIFDNVIKDIMDINDDIVIIEI